MRPKLVPSNEYPGAQGQPSPTSHRILHHSAQTHAQRPRKSPSGAAEVLLYFCSSPKLLSMRAPSVVLVALSHGLRQAFILLSPYPVRPGCPKLGHEFLSFLKRS